MKMREGQAKRRVVYLMISALGRCLPPHCAGAAYDLNAEQSEQQGAFDYAHWPSGYKVCFRFRADGRVDMAWPEIGWVLRGHQGCMDTPLFPLGSGTRNTGAGSPNSGYLHLRADGTFLLVRGDGAAIDAEDENADAVSGLYAVFENPANSRIVIAFLTSDGSCMLGVNYRQGVVETDFGVFHV